MLLYSFSKYYYEYFVIFYIFIFISFLCMYCTFFYSLAIPFSISVAFSSVFWKKKPLTHYQPISYNRKQCDIASSELWPRLSTDFVFKPNSDMYPDSVSFSDEDCAAFTQLDVPILLLPLHSFSPSEAALPFRSVALPECLARHTHSASPTPTHTLLAAPQKKKKK